MKNDETIERDDPIREKDLQTNAVPTDRAYERENYEPAELKNPLPKWFAVMSLGFVVWGAGYFFFQGVVPADAGDRRSVPVQADSAAVDGASVYSANCVSCHQATGMGITGAFPPLAGSGWVLTEPEVPAQILLHGLQGPIEVLGESYAGVMPSMAHLSDEELTAVLNHVRSEWGNQAEPVEVDWLTEQRASFPADRGPWQGEEELREAVGEPSAPAN